MAQARKLDALLVLDFGGQYARLIARRVRELSVYPELVPHDLTLGELDALRAKYNVKGSILSSGPASVYRERSPKPRSEVLESGLPVLGTCYGHHVIAHLYGGEVSFWRRAREVGGGGRLT